MATSEDFSILLLTLKVATVSTLLILPIGVLAAWGLSRWQGNGKGAVETILSLPLVLPPSAVGLVLLEILRRDGVVGAILQQLGIQVVYTWRAAVLACAVMAFPLLVRPARVAFEEIDPRLGRIARTLGLGGLAVFRRVTLPLAWRGIVTGTILAFSRALGEFGATIMVAGNIPGRTQTLALAIFHRSELGHDSAAMRLVMMTTLIAFAAIWTSEALTRKRAQRMAR
jgi:molybdate transport system permease protein